MDGTFTKDEKEKLFRALDNIPSLEKNLKALSCTALITAQYTLADVLRLKAEYAELVRADEERFSVLSAASDITDEEARKRAYSEAMKGRKASQAALGKFDSEHPLIGELISLSSQKARRGW